MFIHMFIQVFTLQFDLCDLVCSFFCGSSCSLSYSFWFFFFHFGAETRQPGLRVTQFLSEHPGGSCVLLFNKSSKTVEMPAAPPQHDMIELPC